MPELADLVSMKKLSFQPEKWKRPMLLVSYDNPRPSRGMVTTPRRLIPVAPKAKRKWPKPSRRWFDNLLVYHLVLSLGNPVKDNWVVLGCLPSEHEMKVPFWKRYFMYGLEIYCVYQKYPSHFFKKPKSYAKFRYLEYNIIFNFCPCSTELAILRFGHPYVWCLYFAAIDSHIYIIIMISTLQYVSHILEVPF